MKKEKLTFKNAYDCAGCQNISKEENKQVFDYQHYDSDDLQKFKTV